MIDYVKILLSFIDIERLKSLPNLTFYRKIARNTGESENKMVAEYHYCKITIYDNGTILFSGSIHKLYNSLNNIKAPNYKSNRTYKGFNGNQFSIENVIEIRTHLTKLFDCQPEQMIFRNIEFGINTEPKFKPNLFIKGLLRHKGKSFEYRHDNNFAQAIHQNLIFKIYDKGTQYKMNTETLRIELKYLRMAEVIKFGIKTFEDIDKHTLCNAKEQLLKRFTSILYYDNTINKKALSGRQKLAIIKYSNRVYWSDLKSNHIDREKKRLKNIINDFSDKLKEQLSIEIINKFDKTIFQSV